MYELIPTYEDSQWLIYGEKWAEHGPCTIPRCCLTSPEASRTCHGPGTLVALKTWAVIHFLLIQLRNKVVTSLLYSVSGPKPDLSQTPPSDTPTAWGRRRDQTHTVTAAAPACACPEPPSNAPPRVFALVAPHKAPEEQEGALQAASLPPCLPPWLPPRFPAREPRGGAAARCRERSDRGESRGWIAPANCCRRLCSSSLKSQSTIH